MMTTTMTTTTVDDNNDNDDNDNDDNVTCAGGMNIVYDYDDRHSQRCWP